MKKMITSINEFKRNIKINEKLNQDDFWKLGTIVLNEKSNEFPQYNKYVGTNLDVYQEMIFDAPDYITSRIYINGEDLKQINILNPKTGNALKDLIIIEKTIDVDDQNLGDWDDIVEYANKKLNMPTIEELNNKINNKNDIIQLYWLNGLFIGKQSVAVHKQYNANKESFIQTQLNKWNF